ncbi:hypothetical protein RAS1_29250 [Phycisphaerae bacterium RAS1]|nr:hypothetical protein RAS1_29250 [Phycisphaerae bacterium RAS1]
MSWPWKPNHPLASWALKHPRDFEFFQLAHLIERARPEMARLGEHGPPADEPLRMRPALSLGFPAADIDASEWREDQDAEGKLQLTLTFLGLYGSNSPLATHFTESLLDEQDDDIRVREFVDLFHHRVYSLLFRVWKKYRYYITFNGYGTDAISQIVRGFLGAATKDTAEQLTVSPLRLFRYIGLITQRPRSAAGLAGLLRDFFENIPFDVEQCVGRWLVIDDADMNRMGGRNCSLGRDMLLGERVYDRAGKYRIKIGPVGLDHYIRFLPNGDELDALREVASYYCGDPLLFDVQVTLKGEEVPELPLGGVGQIGRLGWTGWAKTRGMGDQSVIFNVPAKG